MKVVNSKFKVVNTLLVNRSECSDTSTQCLLGSTVGISLVLVRIPVL